MAKQAKRKARHQAQSQAWKIGSAILFGAVLVLCLLDRTGIYTQRDWKQLFGVIQPVEGDCTVQFVDVGQGDCVYIHSGESDVLIDAGEAEYGQSVVQYLEAQGVQSLDYVISTHPHSDHVGGLAAVIAQIPTEHVMVSDIPEDDLPITRAYENFLTAVDDAGLSLTIAQPGTTYAVGDATLSVLGPLGSDYESMNNYSVVTMLTHGENKFLLTGDMEEKAEKELLKADVLQHADVLKVGHHGSSTSSKKKFLDVVTPDYAVIECGDNSYNHPNEATVTRLQEYTDRIYRTDLQGTVIFCSDGETLTVKTEQD